MLSNSFRLSLLFVLKAQVNDSFLTIRALQSKISCSKHKPPIVVARIDSSHILLSAVYKPATKTADKSYYIVILYNTVKQQSRKVYCHEPSSRGERQVFWP